MPKKSSGPKRAILRSIPRHRIGRKNISDDGQEGERNDLAKGGFLGLSRSKYFSFGEKCFDLLFYICQKMHVIGFTRTSTGEYVLLDHRGQILHYAAMTWYVAVFVQKITGTVYFLWYEDLRIQSFMCICFAFVQFCGALESLGVLMRPQETVNVLNSWFQACPRLEAIDAGTKFNPFHDNSTCSKVVVMFLLAEGSTAWMLCVSLVMSDLPICFHPMAEKFGLLPDGILPRWAWQIIFAPLEWLTLVPPMSICAFATSILFVTTGALNLHQEPLRRMCVNSVGSRQRLERLYVQLELFNRIFQVWIRFYFPSWLVGIASAAIISIFITLRYMDLPIVLYLGFLQAALSTLSVIFWQSYDMISVTRGSEDILGDLLQHHAPYFQGKTRRERVDLMKTARSMRPLGFRVADCEFSLNVPMSTWDEVVNQVMFLLSL